MVELPKGRGCTLCPTAQAVQNGFYNLKDVKLVLEQSLIRTRATLSVHDMVHTWHRGKKYDLRVTKVTPSAYGAVTCINTDIEVDIGEAEGSGAETQAQQTIVPAPGSVPVGGQVVPLGGQVLGGSGGRRLDDTSSLALPATEPPAVLPAMPELLPEPPADQSEGVCTVQIRANSAHGRRRFDIRMAALKDLFAFADTLVVTNNNGETTDFQLVTRFPRRVFHRRDESSLLVDSGIQSGQELFLVEKL
jgi:hypothetical protein